MPWLSLRAKRPWPISIAASCVICTFDKTLCLLIRHPCRRFHFNAYLVEQERKIVCFALSCIRFLCIVLRICFERRKKSNSRFSLFFFLFIIRFFSIVIILSPVIYFVCGHIVHASAAIKINTAE